MNDYFILKPTCKNGLRLSQQYAQHVPNRFKFFRPIVLTSSHLVLTYFNKLEFIQGTLYIIFTIKISVISLSMLYCTFLWFHFYKRKKKKRSFGQIMHTLIQPSNCTYLKEGDSPNSKANTINPKAVRNRTR